MKNKESGFTIVELLIVIVIIGILAALVIVAYTGITARANTAKAKTNATAIQKKLEAWAADSSAGSGAGNGTYPLTAAAVTAMGGSATLPSGVTVGRVDPGTGNATTTVGYKVCTTSTGAGYQITFYDSSTGLVDSTVTGGSQTSCTYPLT
ncbi:MAG: prepilin-type N-terminal cleavage/methylation domain-containing protein [Candidatus Saccharibacteria bacterium]|nr:prepilin-type N-terminal cleavage/methylation domain-containing protein [Candidatus Saccharibacteria bacterium]